uniref:ATP-citrate lyase/succinyl-CoA ligase domain-containing protein n=1 Tax=Meloidogyne incognita TaxID=6306 RepID=A0A914LZY4_MELIC
MFSLKFYFSAKNWPYVGGSATVEQVSNAFKIVASSNDQKIKAIFVNIFAGILRCDIIAEGVIDACNELESNIPVVLRVYAEKSFCRCGGRSTKAAIVQYTMAVTEVAAIV